MAEFCEVMKQAKRMCRQIADCNECPLDLPEGCKMQPYSLPDEWDVEEFEKAADIVMDWAEKHPEPRYPSWNEAWKQLFPDAEEAFAPCLKRMLPSEHTHKYCAVYPSPLCAQCRAQPITPDIAEKLGVKPIGGSDNG